MERFDVLFQENQAYAHGNTGFMWMRRSQVTSDAWNQVLEMDLKETSRDQFNFNTVSKNRISASDITHTDGFDLARYSARPTLDYNQVRSMEMVNLSTWNTSPRMA